MTTAIFESLFRNSYSLSGLCISLPYKEDSFLLCEARDELVQEECQSSFRIEPLKLNEESDTYWKEHKKECAGYAV